MSSHGFFLNFLEKFETMFYHRHQCLGVNGWNGPGVVAHHDEEWRHVVPLCSALVVHEFDIGKEQGPVF